MSQTKQQVFNAALSLPEEDREELADRLMESIGYAGPDDAQFEAELLRRAKEMDEDPSSSVSWEDVKAKWDRNGAP